MHEPLHEHLAHLSERAKKAVDAIREASRETREKVAARRAAKLAVLVPVSADSEADEVRRMR